MKNMIIFMIYSVSSVLVAMIPSVQPTKLYIENHYGSLIFCKTNCKKIVIPSNGDSINLGKVVSLGRVVDDGIYSLAISTQWSGMTSLDNYLKKFFDERDENVDKDAVLMINPSGILSSWDIKPLWRKRDCISTFSMESPESDANSMERLLQLGIGITPQSYLATIEDNNYFGVDYADKVRTLHQIKYDEIQNKYKNYASIYAKLYSFGYPSLIIIMCGIKYNYEHYISYASDDAHDHPGNKTPDEVKDFIKKIIDRQWELYLAYKSNGWLD